MLFLWLFLSLSHCFTGHEGGFLAVKSESSRNFFHSLLLLCPWSGPKESPCFLTQCQMKRCSRSATTCSHYHHDDDDVVMMHCSSSSIIIGIHEEAIASFWQVFLLKKLKKQGKLNATIFLRSRKKKERKSSRLFIPPFLMELKPFSPWVRHEGSPKGDMKDRCVIIIIIILTLF